MGGRAMNHQPTSNLVNVDNLNTNIMREKLVREITGLERDLQRLALSDDAIDFSMEQTYREMIHERREMLLAIPKQGTL